MKTSIVPAQVVSIEDTIVGNLTLIQVVLLTIPVMICAIVIALLPPVMQLGIYKAIVAFVLSVPCLLLAIRWQGRLVLYWLQMEISYQLRPRFYLLTQFDNQACACLQPISMNQATPSNEAETNKMPMPALNPKEQIALAKRINVNKKLKFFTNQKGEIDVVI